MALAQWHAECGLPGKVACNCCDLEQGLCEECTLAHTHVLLCKDHREAADRGEATQREKDLLEREIAGQLADADQRCTSASPSCNPQ